MFGHTDDQKDTTEGRWRRRRRKFLITSGRSWNWSVTGGGGGRVIETCGVSGSVAAVTET